MGRDRGVARGVEASGSGAFRPDDPLAPLADAVGRLFDYYNALHWDGVLARPVVHWGTQAPNGRRLGHYSPDRWQDGESTRDELAVFADLCLERGWEEVALTVLHEMVHQWERRIAGDEPTSNHHGGRWHREARRVGLATRGPRGATSPTDRFRDELAASGVDVDTIPWRRRDAKKPSTLRKWTCGCTIVRASYGQELDAVCMKCGRFFVGELRDGELGPEDDLPIPEMLTCPRCERLVPAEHFDPRYRLCASCYDDVRNVGRLHAYLVARAIPRALPWTCCELAGVGTWPSELDPQATPF